MLTVAWLEDVGENPKLLTSHRAQRIQISNADWKSGPIHTVLDITHTTPPLLEEGAQKSLLGMWKIVEEEQARDHRKTRSHVRK